MINKGLLNQSETSFLKSDSIDYFGMLKSSDQMKLNDLKNSYGGMTSNTLIKHTYKNYPFWAIKSLILDNILDSEEIKVVNDSKPTSNSIILFTIGYEGVSLESYLLKLIKNGVKVLVDVRRNPLSMKFGFSKTLLKKYCSAVDIEYIHIPEVGIESESRKSLNSQADYDKLFENYKKTNLTRTLGIQTNILNLLKE
ncbi:MAG: DUF488 family protein, partial [Sphingobacterium sp.]